VGDLSSRTRRGAHRAPLEIGRTLAGVVAVAAVAGGAFYLVGPTGNDDQVSARVASGSSHVSPSADAESAGGKETRRARPSAPKPSDVKPSDVKPSDVKPSEVKPSEVKATSTPATTRSDSATAEATQSSGRDASVVVLNQTAIAGLAASTGGKLRSQGWNVTGTGNFHGTVGSTTVYYPPGLEAQATSLAADLGVERVRPRFGNLSTSKLTVVVTG
jgi:LytR cell envelope-related transcriptional attenuator